MGAPPVAVSRCEDLFLLMVRHGLEEIARLDFDGLVAASLGIGPRSSHELVKTGEALRLWHIKDGVGRGRKQSLQLSKEAIGRFQVDAPS